ncbi:methyltransferase [bacterium]|nr:methyltransferase [bacterium]
MSSLATPVASSIRQLRVAFPQQSFPVGQDAEWCVVYDGGEWREFRFHDYAQIYSLPGLYEKIFMEHLKSRSHMVMAEALVRELQLRNRPLEECRILDLGAGNGHVGAQLYELGARHLWGVDVLPEARFAARRQHPQVYSGYTLVEPGWLRELQDFRFDTVICVAALGFGDIDPNLFETVLEALPTGSLLAFNIKEQFLNALDPSGFNHLFTHLQAQGKFKPLRQWKHFHRYSTWGEPLHYLGVLAEKP